MPWEPLVNQHVQNWLDSARYDLGTAEHMHETGRYIYTVFFCHLAIEKVLKARIQHVSGELPPRTHSLRHLVERGGLALPDDLLEFVSMLSDVSVPTRYPDDFAKLIEAYDRPVATRYLRQTREAFEWISGSLTS